MLFRFAGGKSLCQLSLIVVIESFPDAAVGPDQIRSKADRVAISNHIDVRTLLGK